MKEIEHEIHEAIQDKFDAYCYLFGCNDWDITVYLSVETYRKLGAGRYAECNFFGVYAEEDNGKRSFAGHRVFIVNDYNHPDYSISIENKRLKNEKEIKNNGK